MATSFKSIFRDYLSEIKKQLAAMGERPEYRSSLNGNGQEVPDTGETLRANSEKLNRLLTERRYAESYGPDWRDLRISKLGWTVPEYERQVVTKYQSLVESGYKEALFSWDNGELSGLNKNQAIGSSMDGYARVGLKEWAKINEISEGRLSSLLQVNRRQYYLDGSRNYSIPNVVVGRGSLILDASMTDKTFTGTPQVRNFLENSPHMYGRSFIVQPMAIGGSYEVRDYRSNYRLTVPAFEGAQLPGRYGYKGRGSK
ncbi:hypothetical protein C2I19_19520 [Chromobacterium alticapitis]|uniref:Uncharacterized protein n=2 Tax=Chromobacterium alticapitis TaxID=2073169 RepID=A0A2S5DB80_9NEIS|nr:hypothetical protein C2I19_19520 [Chromobacterium alticapitis]